MNPVLQVGLWKSGNFWLYSILRNIFLQANVEQFTNIESHPIHELAKNWQLSNDMQAYVDMIKIRDSGTFFIMGEQYHELIENLDDYLSHTTHVWTESLFCARTPEVLSKFDKIVYVIRDPRDQAISMSHFAFTPYMQKHMPTLYANPDEYLEHSLKHQVGLWCRHVGMYLTHHRKFNIHVVFYERLLHDFDQELEKLLEYLEINLNETQIESIKNQVDYKTMRDRNPNHVRKGKSGNWTKVLSAQQINDVKRIAGPMLKILNYGILSESSSLPFVPMDITSDQLDRAIYGTMRARLRNKAQRILSEFRLT